MHGETAMSDNPRLDRVEAILATMGERLDRTGEAQRNNSETLSAVLAIQRETSAIQRDTEEKLNAFITSVHEFEDASVADHKRLLTAQVLMQEELVKVREVQREADARMSALISIVDEMIRKPRL